MEEPVMLEIHLPPELEQQLQTVAQQAGTSAETYVVRLLQQNLQSLQLLGNMSQRLPHNEAQLLQSINSSLSQIDWDRYHALLEKRRAEVLTADEHTELIALSDQIEEINVRRIQDLVELAQLRNTSIDDLINELGLKPIANV